MTISLEEGINFVPVILPTEKPTIFHERCWTTKTFIALLDKGDSTLILLEKVRKRYLRLCRVCRAVITLLQLEHEVCELNEQNVDKFNHGFIFGEHISTLLLSENDLFLSHFEEFLLMHITECAVEVGFVASHEHHGLFDLL